MHVAVLPFTSVTVHFTVVFPTGKVAGALFVTDATPQLSAVTGVPKVTPVAEHKPGAALTFTVEGHVMVGSWLSATVTSWLQVAVFPFTSVTVHFTTVFPSGKEAGALFVTDAMPQLSAVTGVPKLTPAAEHWPVFVFAFTVGGQDIVGGWSSDTFMEKLQFATPQPFVAVVITFVDPALKEVPEFCEYVIAGEGMPVAVAGL